MLWSKPLPNGRQFDLDTETPGGYLHHRSELGEYWLGSDAVMASFSSYLSTKALIAQIPPDEVAHFDAMGYTIGSSPTCPTHRFRCSEAWGKTSPYRPEALPLWHICATS